MNKIKLIKNAIIIACSALLSAPALSFLPMNLAIDAVATCVRLAQSASRVGTARKA